MKRYIQILKTLFQIAPDRKLQVIQLFLSSLVYNIVSLLPPIATSGIIAVITEGGNFSGIWIYVGLYVIFYALYFSALWWNYYMYYKLSDYYHIYVQSLLFEHVADNDSIFDEISSGKISETCSDDIRYLSDVVDASAEAAVGIIQLLVIFCIFISYNVFVAMIAIAIDVIYIILMNNNSKKVAKGYDSLRKHEDKIMDIFGQILGNLKQVKSLDIMPGLDKKLQTTKNRWSSEYKVYRRNLNEHYCALPAIVYIGKILLYIFLAYLVINGQMTIDKLVLLISYFEMVITNTDSTLEYLLNLNKYGIRVNRIKTILDYNQAADFEYGDVDNDYIEGRVVFDEVYYDADGKRILDNVSFKAFPNEITVIVGRPGAGKTTVINLLYRLGHVKSGSILIDDESIYNYSKKVYSSNVSGVYQRPISFKMSITENLNLINRNKKDQIAAMKRVGLHKDIEKLPKGYNTILDKDHPVLSDGQLQKLAIARALLSKAEILLFDEVTSNIDPDSTAEVIEILKDLKEDHTVIITTHKPSIMSIADNVIVMKDGRVVAKGKNSTVLKRSALYRKLKNID